MTHPSTVRKIIGPTIILASGVYFDLLNPEGSAFSISDIAHGLSMTCRFAGQSPRFYSVAEHCVHVSRIVPLEIALAGLLHDAAEAFIGDMSKPLKSLLPEYSEIEARIEAAIFARFGLSAPLSPEIKKADLSMLAAEQRQLFANKDDWQTTGGLEPASVELLCLSPRHARRMFIDRFNDLR